MAIHKVKNNFIPTQQRTSRDAQLDKLKEASQMYEKQFLKEMVNAMRATVKHSEMNAPSMAQRIYQDEQYDNYVDNWGNSGGIGLGDMIYTQLKDRYFPEQNLMPPQGPIPINKESKPIEIYEKGNRQFKIKQNEDKNSVSMSIEGSGPVVSPWPGKVIQAFKTDEDVNLVKIKHDNGLVSTLSFTGTANADLLKQLSSRQEEPPEVLAGHRLGSHLTTRQNLTWILEKASS